ncbi:MAG TPA: hypothetical protein VFI38_10820 [Candidatus Acidoferrum sp.]|nr:hypothetical protein [Candidatus Acidoferrum sp.]
MPASYKVDIEQRWVHTMIWGAVSLTDVLSILEKGLMDPEVDPNFAEIVDLTEVTKMNLSVDEMRVLAQKSALSLRARRAIVVPDNGLVLELARTYEILRELQGETGIRIFHTLDEALSWVAPKNTRA